MLKNLERLLYDKGISKKAYASMLGVNEKTIQNKISGKTDFTYPEASKTQSLLFPEYRIDYLFAEAQDTL